MESSRARIAGPAIAAGAVSVGLVLVGVFGVDPEDTYVAPPPLKSDPYQAAPARDDDSTETTTVRITIPPSPSWQIAPAGAPRRPAGFTTVTDATDPSSTETPSSSESATRTPSRTTTPDESETAEPTAEPTTTTRTRTLTLESTTTAPDSGAAEETVEDPTTE